MQMVLKDRLILAVTVLTMLISLTLYGLSRPQYAVQLYGRCDVSCERSVIMASVALAAWVEYASILVYSGLH